MIEKCEPEIQKFAWRDDFVLKKIEAAFTDKGLCRASLAVLVETCVAEWERRMRKEQQALKAWAAGKFSERAPLDWKDFSKPKSMEKKADREIR